MTRVVTPRPSINNATVTETEFHDLHHTISTQIRSDPKSGVKSARQGVSIAKQRNEVEWQARYYMLLGNGYARIEEYQKAQRYYTKARTIFQKLGKSLDECVVDNAIADIYLAMGKYEEAAAIQDRLSEAIERGEYEANIQFFELIVYLHLGFARRHTRLDHYMEAIRYSYNALDLCEKNAVSVDAFISALLTTGGISYLLGDLLNATEYFQQALAASVDIDDVEGRYSALYHLSRLARDQGNFSAALGYQEQALYEAQDKLGPISIACCHTLAGSIYFLLNQLKRSREHFDYALDLFSETSSVYWKGEAMFGSALASFAEGKVDQALEEMLEILSFLEKKNYVAKTAFCHKWLAKLYEKIGDHKSALKHFRLEAALAEQVGGREQQRAMARLQLDNKIQELERKLQESHRELHKLKKKIQEKEVVLSATAKSTRSDSWETFRQTFDGLHQRFKAVLVRQFPKLTPTELKVCYLLRSGLISKEIAEVLSISPASVDVYRHRIRKKMELLPQVNLVSYLNSI